MVEVARRSPVPIATGESFTSAAQFADLLAARRRSTSSSPSRSISAGCGGPARSRRWPMPTWASSRRTTPAARSARRSSAQLGGCIPNFYVQESFDEFNSDWSREIVDRPTIPRNGHVDVPTAPGLGVDLDWERLAAHPYQREHVLHLFTPGWERRDDAPMPAPDPGS